MTIPLDCPESRKQWELFMISRVNIERIDTDTMKSFIPKKTSNFQETQNSV